MSSSRYKLIPELHRLTSQFAIRMAKFGYAPPAPNVDYLMLAAAQVTGKDDWGPDFPYEALTRLFDSYRSEAELSLKGRFRVEKMLVERLVHRLEIQEMLVKNPDILDRPVKRPLFITGMPRTGSTLLHRLMALDPANRTLKFWEAWHPCPPIRPNGKESNPRIENSRRYLRKLYQSYPNIRAIHSESATGATECIGLLMNSLMAQSFNLFGKVPGYLNWLYRQSAKPTYQYHCVQLQILNYYENDVRWVLKAPVHRYNLDSLMEQYPDALIVFSHRDPLQVAPSLASLRLNVRGQNSSKMSAYEHGHTSLNSLRESTNRFILGRKSIPEKQIHDVSYLKLISDPVGCLRGIYQFAGYEFPNDMEERIHNYLAERTQNQYGRHRYSLEEFGMSREEIEHDFADYYKEFGSLLSK